MLGKPIMVIRETSEKHIGGFLLRACRPTFAFCRHCPHRVPTVYSFPSPQRDRAHNVPKLVCAQKYADFVRRRTNISAHERLMRRDVVHQTLPRTDQCTLFFFFEAEVLQRSNSGDVRFAEIGRSAFAAIFCSGGLLAKRLLVLYI